MLRSSYIAPNIKFESQRVILVRADGLFTTALDRAIQDIHGTDLPEVVNWRWKSLDDILRCE